MTPNEFIKLTSVTDHDTSSVNKLRHHAFAHAELLHYVLGVGTEAGELQDALKKAIAYGKPLDEINMKEECSDILWYLARIMDYYSWSFEEVMQLNIDKLKVRYGDKFTEHAALNRDLDAERKLLEGAVDGK